MKVSKSQYSCVWTHDFRGNYQDQEYHEFSKDRLFVFPGILTKDMIRDKTTSANEWIRRNDDPSTQ